MLLSLPSSVARAAVWTAADAARLAQNVAVSLRGSVVVALDANHRPVEVVPVDDEPADAVPVARALTVEGTRVGTVVVTGGAPPRALPTPRPAFIWDWLVVPRSGAARSLCLDHAWPRPHPGAAAESERLRALVDILDETGVDRPPQILHVEGNTLGIHALDGADVHEALLGFTAPDSWDAIGLESGGWTARSAWNDDAVARGRLTRRPSESPDARRVRLVTMVGRRGGLAAAVQIAGGETIRPEEAGEGVLGDALRRALALPTNPPRVPTDELFAVMWLRAVAAERATTWDAIVDLHPAVRLLGDDLSHEPAQVACAVRALGRVCGWDQIREQIAAGRYPDIGLEAALAGWMDEGMTARWLLGAASPLADTLARAERIVRRPAAIAIHRVLREVGLVIRRGGRREREAADADRDRRPPR